MMNSAEQPRSFEAVLAAWLECQERGETVDAQQWIQRYPEHADQLREFLELDAQLSEMGLTGKKEQDQEAVATSVSSLVNRPPAVLGDYEILEEISRGGMGVVFKARHRTLGRLVALKVIRSGELASDEEMERFLSEAEAAAALTHPAIVPIYDMGRVEGLVYYTMAFIEGRSLADILREGPMEPLEAARVVHKLCQAISYAHREGVFHRDLKPANILINADGHPVIIDFGLAKMIHHDKELTTTWQILGTPAYIPPEAATGSGAASGVAVDVYGLGAILYTLCTGQPPFTGPTPFDVLLQVLDVAPPPPSRLNRKVGRSLDFICLKALEKPPEDRYQSADELAADLECALTGQPINRPQVTWVQWLHNWWQRDPILVAHVMAIGISGLIVAMGYPRGMQQANVFPLRMGVLIGWMIISFLLQIWVYRARWRDVAIVSWLVIDVLILTGMMWLAQPPRSLLLIGYPMMMVASSLFYRRRFVTVTAALCIASFLFLSWQFSEEEFVRRDFNAIFITGLLIIWLCLITMIHRMRGLSRFYETGIPNA